MRKILITGAGGPSAIAVFKSLSKLDAELYMADMCPNAPGLFLVETNARSVVPKATHASFVENVLALCIHKNIDLLIPTVDEELLPLAVNRKAFTDAGIQVALSNTTSLAKCLDKFTLMQTCAKRLSLANYALHTQETCLDSWQFPVIAKPRSGSGSRGVLRLDGYSDYQSIAFDENLLLQEYLPGKEYSVDVFVSQQGMCLACVPRQRVKVDSGVAIVSKTLHDQTLTALALQVMAVTGLTGVANIQFKEDAQGIPKLLEVNPRFSGTMPLTVAAGADIPSMVLSEARSELQEKFVKHRELATVRYLQERFIAVTELAA